MSSRYQEQQGQHSSLPQERERGTAPVEPGSSRPPAPNREGPGPTVPMLIILGIIVIFVLLFAFVLM